MKHAMKSVLNDIKDESQVFSEHMNAMTLEDVDFQYGGDVRWNAVSHKQTH